MKLLENEGISVKRWTELLSVSKFTSPFQTPEFFELFNSIPGNSAEVFAVEDKSVVSALCVVTLQKEPGIKSCFSKRAIVYGGPVLLGADAKVLLFLLTSISKEFKRSSIYLEIRNLNNYDQFHDVFILNRWSYLPYLNFIVDCSDKELLIRKLGKNRKRQIKKAVESGVTIKEAENLSEIDEFYIILNWLYRTKIKKPLLPRQFFEEFFNRDLGKFLLVKQMGKIIGGIMCPILEGRCIYEFYVCGLDEDYKDQHPSIMATWAAMEYANSNNIPLFDFMGAGMKDKDYGVRDFKSRFGGDLVENGRYLMIFHPSFYNLGKFALSMKKIFKR